jgi:ribosomal protein L37E
VRVEDSVIGTTSASAAGVIQKAITTKMCRRCGVKAHLMYECTVTVFCEICRSTDHAMSRCPILKQPKPIASWVVRLLMHLLVFIFRMHQSNQQREILEWL